MEMQRNGTWYMEYVLRVRNNNMPYQANTKNRQHTTGVLKMADRSNTNAHHGTVQETRPKEYENANELTVTSLRRYSAARSSASPRFSRSPTYSATNSWARIP